MVKVQSFKNDQLYAAIAYDDDMKGLDTLRVAAEFLFGDFTVGAIYQDSDQVDSTKFFASGDDSEDGTVLSATYKAGDYKFKVLYGMSDMLVDEGDLIALGVDKKLGKKTKVFAYYADLGADDKADEETWFGVGIEHKFSSVL